MFNTNDENEKDEGLNLSDMINEYEEDNVLRNKIEALKAEKAQEEAQRSVQQAQKEEETSKRSALGSTRDLPRYGSASGYDGTFLDTDETQEAASDEVDGDKTMVVMDNPVKHEFEDTESILYYGDHEVDAEEITEEDIQEFLGNENVKKQRKPMDPKKMNKIITYVISSVVVVCILVGAGFGIKMAINAFSNEEPSEPAEKPTTDKDKPVTKPNTTPTETPKNNEVDSNKNAVRIAEINGSIKAKQQQVTDLNTAVNNAKSEIERLTNEAQALNDNYATKNAEYSNINNKVTEAKDALQKAEAALAAGTGKQENVDVARKTWETISSALTIAQSERDNAKISYDGKESEKSKKITEKDGYVSQISTIQLDIDNLQKELQSLQ